MGYSYLYCNYPGLTVALEAFQAAKRGRSIRHQELCRQSVVECLTAALAGPCPRTWDRKHEPWWNYGCEKCFLPSLRQFEEPIGRIARPSGMPSWLRSRRGRFSIGVPHIGMRPDSYPSNIQAKKVWWKWQRLGGQPNGLTLREGHRSNEGRKNAQQRRLLRRPMFDHETKRDLGLSTAQTRTLFARNLVWREYRAKSRTENHT